MVDDAIEKLLGAGLDDEAIAWQLTDGLVREAQQKFAAIHRQTKGNAGWVSFELDPLIEDPDVGMSIQDRASQYIELGKQWAEDIPIA